MKALKLNSSMVITAIAILCICLFLFDKCGKDTNVIAYNGSDSLKQVISEQTKIKDSLLLVAKKKDTIRVTLVRNYRTTITDTIIKQVCDPVIKLCDSIILVDSSEIVDLKNVIKVDSNIIANYKKVAETDSITIVSLTKEVKKHKRHKRWLVGGIISVGIIAALK